MDGGYNISPICAGGWADGEVPAARWQTGGVATRSSAGVVNITLTRPCDAANRAITITQVGAAGADLCNYLVEHVSDTVIRVRSYVSDGEGGGELTDSSFDWHVFRGAKTPNL